MVWTMLLGSPSSTCQRWVLKSTWAISGITAIKTQQIISPSRPTTLAWLINKLGCGTAASINEFQLAHVAVFASRSPDVTGLWAQTSSQAYGFLLKLFAVKPGFGAVNIADFEKCRTRIMPIL